MTLYNKDGLNKEHTNCLCKKLKVTESNDIKHNVLFIFINLIVPYGSTFAFYKNLFNFDITPYKAHIDHVKTLLGTMQHTGLDI